MVKQLLYCYLFLFTVNTYSQSNCSNAVAIGAGTTTIGTISGDAPTFTCDSEVAADHGAWYTYTASKDGYAEVTTYLPENSGKDTNMFVYSGTCGNFSCLANNDDLSASIYLSKVYIPITNGETYYIVFDDRWSASGFDLKITETTVACSDGSLPISEDFSDWTTIISCWESVDSNLDGFRWVLQDLDGGNLSLVSESYSPSSADEYGFLNPDNWIISYPIDLTAFSSGSIIELTWKARGYSSTLADENYSVYAATSKDLVALENSPVTFSEIIGDNGGAGIYASKSMDLSSLAGNTIYVAFRHHNMSEPQFKLTIDDIAISTATLDVAEVEPAGFKHFYSTKNKSLTLKSRNALQHVTIYNILGESIFSKALSQNEESFNLSSLTNGIYITKVQVDETIKTIKFFKQ